MIREERMHRLSKRPALLMLPALLVVMLTAFIAFASEDALASGEYFEIKQSEYYFSEDELAPLITLSNRSSNAMMWISSDPSIARIEKSESRYAKLKIHSYGDIYVRAWNENHQLASCIVHIEHVNDFEFDETELFLNTNDESFNLELTNDFDTGSDEYTVDWTSSNGNVISISDPTNTSSKLIINGSGEATVTAEDTLGNSASCHITISDSLKLDTNSVTINYKYDPYYEFDANEPYCYFHNYAICNIGPADYIQPVSGRITNVYSRSPSIATIKEVSWYDDTWVIIPKSAGTAQIVCEGEDGDSQILKVTVPGKYMNSFIGYYTRCSAPYGEPVSIKAPAGAKVKLSYCGKTYNGTATGSSRTCSFNVPIKKLGTAYNYKVTYGNYTYSRAGKIQGSNSTINTKRIFKSTRKTKLTLTNVHKGDTVYIKAGNKTIKKKIKKNCKKYSFTVKLPAKKTEGKKVKITIKNKFKQTVKTKSYLIWYSTKLHKGMTKKQCKLVPGLGSPDRWYWKGRYLLWCYDSSDNGYAQLMFRNGRLWSWYY